MNRHLLSTLAVLLVPAFATVAQADSTQKCGVTKFSNYSVTYVLTVGNDLAGKHVLTCTGTKTTVNANGTSYASDYSQDIIANANALRTSSCKGCNLTDDTIAKLIQYGSVTPLSDGSISKEDAIAKSQGKEKIDGKWQYPWQQVAGPDGKPITVQKQDDGTYLTSDNKTLGSLPDQKGKIKAGTRYLNADGEAYQSKSDFSSHDGFANGGSIVTTDKDGTTTTYTQGTDGHIMKTVQQKGDKTGVTTDTTAIADKKRDATNEEKDPNASDDCYQSYLYAKKLGKAVNAEDFKCSGTHTLANATKVTNQVLQTAGASVINSIGSANITAAQQQNGPQSAILDGSAKASKTAFTYQTAVTAANLVATAALAKKANQHGQNLATIQRDLNKYQDDAVLAGAVNNTAAREAATEQAEAKKTAKDAATLAATMALQSGVNAANARSSQRAMERAANTQRQIEAQLKAAAGTTMFDASGMASNGTIDPSGLSTLGTAASTSDSSATTGTTTTDPNANTGLTANLGTGTDLGAGNDSGPAGPPAGKFSAANTAGGGGGAPGAAGGAMAGGAGAPPPTPDDPKAQYTTDFGTKEKYENGSAPGGAAKAAGGKGGSASDGSGIDLNGLLAQFLPKDGKDMPEGITAAQYQNFGGGAARGLASEEAPSYLDKTADLFQRIHETMSEKNRKGHVGL